MVGHFLDGGRPCGLRSKATEKCFAKAEQSLWTTAEKAPQNDFIVSRGDKDYEMEEGRKPSKVMNMISKCLMSTFDQTQALELERSPPGL